MYLVDLGWIEYSRDGFISSKDATVNVFRTEGDDFLKTLQNFKIISKRTTGKLIYRGRVSWFDID